MKLFFERPAQDNNDGWQNYSFPIGNGYMGANIFGRIDRERIQLTEESLWTGGPSAGVDGIDFADYGIIDREGNMLNPSYYKKARDLALAKPGDISPPDTNLVASKDYSVLYHMLPKERVRLGAFQNFCELYFQIGHVLEGNTEYERSLDINTAVSEVKYNYQNVVYRREYFISYPARVMAVKFTASENSKISFTFNPTIPYVMGRRTGQVIADTSNGLEMSGELLGNGLRFAGYFKLVNDGGTVTTATLDDDGNSVIRVDGADSVVVYLSLGTDYTADFDKKYRTGIDPMLAVRSRVNKAVATGYDKLKEEHITDYSAIFSRVELSLGGNEINLPADKHLDAYREGNDAKLKRAYEELYFQYGRYLLIASSREGCLPANLQGVWNVYKDPCWSSDYHLNINLQMNYWPANNTNMKETLYALVDYVDALRKPGRLAAEHIYGVAAKNEKGIEAGWVAHLSCNIFGYVGFMNPHMLINNSGSGYCQYSPESGMWLIQNVYNMYQYYPDEKYLRSKIYPMLRECALFFSHEEVLVDDPVSGRKVMSPTHSSEHGPMWGGGAFQQQLLWQLFTDTIEAAEILDIDEELRVKLAYLLPLLRPVEIGEKSGLDATPGIKEWWWETAYGESAAGKIPAFDPGHRHNSHLVALYPGNIITKDTPETMNAAISSMNARGDGATGWSRGMKTCLWARTGDGDRAYKIFHGLITDATLPNMWDYHYGLGNPDTSIGIFQIDGNFGGTAGMAEMLLQSHAGYIEPLAALPSVWPSGTVNGLTARGGFVIDLKWENMELNEMTITSTVGKPCIIKYKGKEIRFATEKGNKYILDRELKLI